LVTEGGGEKTLKERPYSDREINGNQQIEHHGPCMVEAQLYR
jgi:hypothetical protein